MTGNAGPAVSSSDADGKTTSASQRLNNQQSKNALSLERQSELCESPIPRAAKLKSRWQLWALRIRGRDARNHGFLSHSPWRTVGRR